MIYSESISGMTFNYSYDADLAAVTEGRAKPVLPRWMFGEREPSEEEIEAKKREADREYNRKLVERYSAQRWEGEEID